MKLSDLEVLHVVAHSQSLNDAAKRLFKTQPAVTQALKRLSAELGFPLVTREEYRIKLTEQGARFYKEAVKLIEHHENLKAMAADFAQGNEPKFNICYEAMSYDYNCNELIKKTFRQFPSTAFEITSGKRFVALDRVNQGISDIGVGPWFNLFHATGDLESVAIGEVTLGLVAKKGLIPNKLTFDELNQYPCLAMTESGFEFDSDRLEYSKSRSVMKLDDIATIKMFLLQGMGFAIVTLNHCEKELQQGLLEQIRVTDKQDQFTVDIHAFRRHLPHQGSVAQYLWAGFKELGKQYSER
ncbi:MULTISPECIES: LysR family transcriptional regulator [Pseudoalteromonas]|uniref:LysR family transcriptional regulator n=1 Tax=Pseudoalteromonas obscura TaxID=3048491 RepID=A0ABT7EQQ2_9GAMM|nr:MULTISPECIES: LysR family transcriptional regulator [Pseudoalteromonas]MBQ4835093.1 LysR family transcriptional regulator [Pseudoalteromonas luteoviolacea]MDK2597386.1 LysR family transcriptional regulator [Pseudoalteromonas sp. P94(2023)]